MSQQLRKDNSEGDTALTPGAREALKRAGLSRRSFLKESGALIVCFNFLGAAEPGISGSAAAPAQAPQQSQGSSSYRPRPNQLDSWIAIAADGTVIAYTGKSELGQGIGTAQTQLVAEELCVPFDRVKLIACDTAFTPDQGYTSGSQSHPANFNHSNLAQAAATARAALLQLASQKLGVPVEQLAASDGAVALKTDASRKATYPELLGGQKFNLVLDKAAPRKPASEWTILGKPIPRADIPALVTARFQFVHNVRLPGMLYGSVVRPPGVGATLVSVDEASITTVPGIVKVVVKGNFVGVVAEKLWQAVQAAYILRVNWMPGPPLPAQQTFYDHLRAQQPTRDTLLVDSANLDEKFTAAAAVHKATYLHPYHMHGSMGSSCAVADVRDDSATLWSATQGVWFMRNTSAMVLGLKPDNVRVIFTRGSGCYGNNGADPVTYDAAILSQAVGKPVRVQLTRQDEMAWENYGNAFVLDERAALDAQGNIQAWDHESWVPVLGNRPGMERPGNIVTGFLAGFQPEPFAAQTPAPAPTVYNNNSNAIPSYAAGVVAGQAQGTGSISGERVLVHNVVSPFWTGPLRSPERFQNTFAHESFIDELAAKAKADPVEFRLRHLNHQRLREVLKGAASAANWQVRPSPLAKFQAAATRTANRSGRPAILTGRGVSCVAYEGSNGYAAMVAEVEVDPATGAIAVKRVSVCVDCGPISNPQGLRNQTEGGTLQGISRALFEEVTWDDHKITSVDWSTYRTYPLGFAIPAIQVAMINRPAENATGAGELAITIVAPAIANALFDATGARLRQVPFNPERVKAALQQRT